MSTELQTAIDNIDQQFGLLPSDFTQLKNQLTFAGDYIGAQNWPDAEQALDNAGGYVINISGHFSGYPTGIRFYLKEALELIKAGLDEPYKLTMADILSVMVSATSDELENFIGLVDAYRQSLWNKPFNAEFFAALARGFEQWG